MEGGGGVLGGHGEGYGGAFRDKRMDNRWKDAEAMEGCSLLACFPWLAQPALL